MEEILFVNGFDETVTEFPTFEFQGFFRAERIELIAIIFSFKLSYE
jgi:hypothetical protein